VEEAFASFFFPFSEGFVAQVAYFVQISDFYKPLSFSDNSYPFHAIFAVNFLEFFCGNVENAASANVDGFVGL
jgi:hypothetical protein